MVLANTHTHTHICYGNHHARVCVCVYVCVMLSAFVRWFVVHSRMMVLLFLLLLLVVVAVTTFHYDCICARRHGADRRAHLSLGSRRRAHQACAHKHTQAHTQPPDVCDVRPKPFFIQAIFIHYNMYVLIYAAERTSVSLSFQSARSATIQ